MLDGLEVWGLWATPCIVTVITWLAKLFVVSEFATLIYYNEGKTEHIKLGLLFAIALQNGEVELTKISIGNLISKIPLLFVEIPFTVYIKKVYISAAPVTIGELG